MAVRIVGNLRLGWLLMVLLLLLLPLGCIECSVRIVTRSATMLSVSSGLGGGDAGGRDVGRRLRRRWSPRRERRSGPWVGRHCDRIMLARGTHKQTTGARWTLPHT